MDNTTNTAETTVAQETAVTEVAVATTDVTDEATAEVAEMLAEAATDADATPSNDTLEVLKDGSLETGTAQNEDGSEYPTVKLTTNQLGAQLGVEYPIAAALMKYLGQVGVAKKVGKIKTSTGKGRSADIFEIPQSLNITVPVL
jgi:hypothetical protein